MRRSPLVLKIVRSPTEPTASPLTILQKGDSCRYNLLPVLSLHGLRDLVGAGRWPLLRRRAPPMRAAPAWRCAPAPLTPPPRSCLPSPQHSKRPAKGCQCALQGVSTLYRASDQHHAARPGPAKGMRAGWEGGVGPGAHCRDDTGKAQTSSHLGGKRPGSALTRRAGAPVRRRSRSRPGTLHRTGRRAVRAHARAEGGSPVGCACALVGAPRRFGRECQRRHRQEGGGAHRHRRTRTPRPTRPNGRRAGAAGRPAAAGCAGRARPARARASDEGGPK
jgi:hypothetical protein